MRKEIFHMRECKSCHILIQDNAASCPFCGYDPKTDAISPSFKPSAALSKAREKKLQAKGTRIGPGVKMFVSIGLVVIIFTVFYKYNFNPNDVISKIKQDWSEVMSEVKQPWDKVKTVAGDIIPLDVEENKKSREKTEDFNPSTLLIVEGVVWKGRMLQAIINHKVFNMGDTIEGAKIIKISKKGVTVLYKERSYLLPSSVSTYWHD
jgi:hypothetical protein